MNNSTELGGTPPPYGVPPQRGGGDNKGLVTVLWVLVALIAVGIVAALVVFFMNQGKAKEDEMKAQMEQLQAQKDSLRNVASAELHRVDSIAAAKAKSEAAAKAKAAENARYNMLNYSLSDFDLLIRTLEAEYYCLFRTYDPDGWSNIRESPNGTIVCRVKSGSYLCSNGISCGPKGNWVDVIAPNGRHIGYISTKLVRCIFVNGG